MPRETITTKHSPESWGEEIEKYKKGEKVDIYARAGYPELIEREKKFAEMIGAPDTALFNSGMAAIHTAIEAENLRPGDLVLCGKDVYSQTKKLYADLKKRGIKIEMIDSSDMQAIEKEIKEKNPRLIILESVANVKELQVCDIKNLVKFSDEANRKYQEELNSAELLRKFFHKTPYENLPNDFKERLLENIKEFRGGGNPFVFRDSVKSLEEATGLERKQSIREISKMVKYITRNSREKLSLIIDNTLASPILYNPLKDTKSVNSEAVIVESGTKHYQEGKDKITLGIAYSNDNNKINAIKEKRAELGTYLQPHDEREIPEKITEIMPDIIKRHAENALELAKTLSKFKHVTEVSHPNLPTHKQNDLVKEIAPEGLVTLFYVKVPDAVGFVKKVKELGGEKIGVGGSFGHEKTWLFNIGDEVRIAAGAETEAEFKEVIEIFKKALEEYNGFKKI